MVSSFVIYTIAESKLNWYDYTYILITCFTSAVLIERDINRYTKILTFMLVTMALFSIIHTLQKLTISKIQAIIQCSSSSPILIQRIKQFIPSNYYLR